MWNLLLLSVMLNVPPPAPTWHLQTNAGPVEQGALQECGPNGVRVGMGKLLRSDSWATLTRTKAPLPGRPTAPQIVFANGDILTGTLLSGDGDTLLFRPAPSTKAEQLRLPTSALAVLWRRQRTDEEPAWVTTKRTRDVLQLSNGDTLQGSINKLDAKEWQLTHDRPQNVPAENVLALGFNTDLARVRAPKGIYYRVVLRDGSRVRCAAVACDGNAWTLTTLYKDTFTVALADVVQVCVEQGPAVLLSVLKPQYGYASFDGEQQDFSSAQKMLTLHTEAGLTSDDRGLAVPAGGTLTYTLAGKYTRLEATIGMDAERGERGAAQLQIMLDGQAYALPNEGLLQPRRTLTVNVDVRNIKELKVSIQRRTGGAVHAFVNILDGRIYP